MDNLLTVKNLKIIYNTKFGEVQAVKGVDFTIEKGQITAIVGESGSGKTSIARAIVRLLEKNGEINKESEIIFKGKNVISMDNKEIRKLRGAISIVFQQSVDSLNPVMKIGNQIGESLMLHHCIKKKESIKEVITLLKYLNLDEDIAKMYPHELSGGMKQRAMIAIALASSPEIIIGDEITSGLDPLNQEKIVELLLSLKNAGTSIILVTHDLSLAAAIADNILVIYKGLIVERGTSNEIFNNPKDSYTKVLLRAMEVNSIE